MQRLSNLLCSADDAVARIPDEGTIASGGFVGAAHPEALTAAIERRFLQTGAPRNLTLIYGAGQGDGKSRGLNHLGHAGLIKRVIGGHWGLIPKIGQLALANEIEAYNFPQGAIYQLFRDIAAGKPGCITHVGLGTFIDPLYGGGQLNSRSTEPLIERIELGGRTWLFYRAFPIHVALLRASSADPFGNLTMEGEAIVGEGLALAQAVHNSGGIVLAQVKRVLDAPSPPNQVRVPGVLVNQVIVADPHDHQLTFAEDDNPTYYSPNPLSGPANRASSVLPSQMADERRIIAARACDELHSGAIANLGIGMPEGVAAIAAERGLLQSVTLTIESGPIGGMPVGGLSFGAAVYPEAIVDQTSQFDFYDGGGLDFAALGAAQLDRHGNINVSKFGSRVAGVGGFVNISQNAKKVVFCGTLTSGGLRIAVDRGRLSILQEGSHRKFVDSVEQVSFSGEVSRRSGQQVLFVTERAVFRLTADGWELIEVAPGIDVASQIVNLMDFPPIIREIRPMPDHLFHQPG